MSLLFPSSHPAFVRADQPWSSAGIAVAVHALLAIVAIAGFSDAAPPATPEAPPLSVRLLSEQPAPRPATPQPAKPTPLPRAQPLLAHSAPAPVPAPFEVAAAPAQQAVSEAPTASGPTRAAPEAPLVEARFDADYLSNPKPPYPNASRRLGEAGTVHLRVQVSADGTALQVEVKRSSGFARLDQAAVDTVSRWRFVPARRGHTQVISWVVVPIVFSLS